MFKNHLNVITLSQHIYQKSIGKNQIQSLNIKALNVFLSHNIVPFSISESSPSFYSFLLYIDVYDAFYGHLEKDVNNFWPQYIATRVQASPLLIRKIVKDRYRNWFRFLNKSGA